MKKRLLWLDDTRDPSENDWIVFSPIGRNVETFWVMSYDEFVTWITENGLPDGICFDHDLGYKLDPNVEVTETYNGEVSCHSLSAWSDIEKTGYDCAKWLVDYCIKHNEKLPEYAMQSSNPAGRQNIDMLLKNYIKFVACSKN